MSQTKYKSPKTGGAGRIRETFEEQRKRKPSKALLEILKKKPGKVTEKPEKKIAKPRRLRDVEL